MMDLDYKKLEKLLEDSYGKEFDSEDSFYSFYSEVKEYIANNYDVLKTYENALYFRNILNDISEDDVDKILEIANEMAFMDISVDESEESDILYAKGANT